MAPERLAEIEARCAAATPGPWVADGLQVWEDEDGRGFNVAEINGQNHGDTEAAANAAFIAHARTDVPALLAEVERLRALNESLAARVAAQSEILSRKAERTNG